MKIKFWEKFGRITLYYRAHLAVFIRFLRRFFDSISSPPNCYEIYIPTRIFSRLYYCIPSVAIGTRYNVSYAVFRILKITRAV